MLRKINIKNIGWFTLSILCYLILSYEGFIKYAFILLIAMVGLGLRDFCVSSKWLVVLVAPGCYFFAGFLAALINLDITANTFKEACFVLIPAIAAISIFNVVQLEDICDLLDTQFWALAIISILRTTASAEDLFESQYAFVLGAYVIYYYAFKRKAMFCVATLFAYLAHKRIAFAAVIMCILLYTVIMSFKRKQIQKWIINLVVIVTVCASYLWVAGVRLGIVKDILLKLHIESNGRINIWSKFDEYYKFGVQFWGRGIGFVASRLEDIQIAAFANLHNDLMRMYIETGFWGFGLCIFAYFYIIRKSNRDSGIATCRNVLLVSLVVYTFINYLTDNILIYINYWLPVYLLFLGIMYAPLKGEKELQV